MKRAHNPIAGKTLKQLVDRLVSSSLSNSCYGNHVIVNEVPDSMCILVDEQKEGTVISELLATVVTNARNGDIHISADQASNLVTLSIEDRNNYNGYALAARLTSIQPDASRLGGSLVIKDERCLVTRISFSFPILTAPATLPAPRYFA